jgi:hypothetical protein
VSEGYVRIAFDDPGCRVVGEESPAGLIRI